MTHRLCFGYYAAQQLEESVEVLVQRHPKLWYSSRYGENLLIRANEFARDLKARLKETLPFYSWEGEDGQPNINWKPASGERESVDLVGEPPKGKPLLLIEIELRRDDPSANVIKIWKWKKKGILGKFILIQGFSRYYTRRSRRFLERAEFVGEQMKKDKDGEYIPINFSYNPRKGGRVGAGARRHHARYLAGTILRRLHKAGIVKK